MSILLLPVLLSARWSDSYALGLQVGMAALGGVVLGVVYNVALGRPGFRRWRLSALLSAVFSLALGALIIAVAFARDSSFMSLGWTSVVPLVAFSFGGGALAIAGTGAVRLAVHGQAVALTAVNIAPACALLISLLLTAGFGLFPFVPALVWLVAALCQIPFFWRAPVRSATTAGERESRARIGIHVAALGIGVIASTVVPALLIAALSQLPPGSASVAFLITRIATSIIGIGVNSVLLVRYNWSSGTRKIEPLERVLALLSSALLVAATPFYIMASADGVVIGLMIGSWLIALVASALILREVNARRMSLTIAVKVAIDVTLSLIGCAVMLAHPSVGAYFALMILSQGVTLLVASISLRFRVVAGAAAGMVATSMALFWAMSIL